jgi:hypothetical protein
LRAQADALVRHAEVEKVDDISLIELARILDSFDIVRHDCLLIFVKLRRAIDGREDSEREGWDEDPVQNDHNGSAKLALTCIDRSEGACRAIDQWYPSGGGAAPWRSSSRRCAPPSRDDFPARVRFSVPDSMVS